MLFQHTISTIPFNQWLWRDRENRKLQWLSMVTILLTFGWLKIVYPYPNFMPPDSFNYLEAAYKNEFINIWPIGYSRFLRLISSFSNSHLVLVILQYIFLMAGVLYFLFSIRYLFSPSKWIFRFLLTVSLINPLLPHIANFVSSDSLFASLSLIWLTQLLWIMYQARPKMLLLHTVILLAAFMVRYNAIWYPGVSIIVIIATRLPQKMKWLSAASIAVFVMFFISRTRYEYKIKTGAVQFAAFGGWQIAANALYGYAYAKPINTKIVSPKFRDLHRIVNRHMDSLRLLAKRPDEEVGVYYFWDFNSPLRLYMNEMWDTNNNEAFFKKWASMGPLYQEYGLYLISKQPWSFIKHYIWPNLIRYYAPPANFMEIYNLGNKTVPPIAVDWFDWRNNRLSTNTKNEQIKIISLFPALLSIINPLFLISSILFVTSVSFRKCSKNSKRSITCILLIWLSNVFFSILSAPIELRYQIFPVIITIPLMGLLITGIVQSFILAPITNPKKTISLPEISN